MTTPPRTASAWDPEFLASLGLDALPGWEYRCLQHFLRATLETRVGERIVAHMSPDQLDRWTRLEEAGNEEACLALLDEVVPGGRMPLVLREQEELADQLRRTAARIVLISRRDPGEPGDRTLEELMTGP